MRSDNDRHLAAYLKGLARAHRKFGVQKEHFDAFGQALAATWQRYAPEAWTDAAAAGSMTADLTSQRDILCLAGGTGLAPVKAVIEAVIQVPGGRRRREIVLSYGARHESGLYDLPGLSAWRRPIRGCRSSPSCPRRARRTRSTGRSLAWWPWPPGRTATST